MEAAFCALQIVLSGTSIRRGMARLDWEKADKRDYVREHGSIPYWVDLGDGKGKYAARPPEETKTGRALAKKARDRCSTIISRFKKLSAEERLRQVGRYRAEVRDACRRERSAVPESRRKFAVGIDKAERELLGQLKSLARAAQKEQAPRKKSGDERPKALLGIRTDGPAAPTEKPRRKPRKANQQTKQTPKTRKVDAEPKSLRSLKAIAVEAEAAEGKLQVRWRNDGVDADVLMLVVTRHRNGRHEVVRRGSIEEAASTAVVDGLDFAHGPYALRLVAVRGGKAVARGAVEGIVDPAVPLSEAPPRRHRGQRTSGSAETTSKRKRSPRSAEASKLKGRKPSAGSAKKRSPLAEKKICLDGPAWKPLRRCPCPRCRGAETRRKSFKAGSLSAPSSGRRPRATFWRGR